MKWDFHKAEEKALKELARVRGATADLASRYVEAVERLGAAALPESAGECRLAMWDLEAVGQREAAAVARKRLAELEEAEQARREAAVRASEEAPA